MRENFVLLQPKSVRETAHAYNEVQRTVFDWMMKLKKRGFSSDQIIQYISDPFMKEDTDTVSMTSVKALLPTAEYW